MRFEPLSPEAAERRKNLAHGASDGIRRRMDTAPEGRKNAASQGTVLSPLRGSPVTRSQPTACAVGYILSPLRGWFASQLIYTFHLRSSRFIDCLYNRWRCPPLD